MFRSLQLAAGAALAAAVLAAAPAAAASPTAASPGLNPSGASRPQHAVFVQTNDPNGNAIAVYDRAADGALTYAATYATGGRGGALTGAVADKLASQGGLAYDAEQRLLFAVNAGSDTVSVFGVRGDRLGLRQVISSGGSFPVSVAVHDGLVYVLDAGGSGALQGYREAGGRLRAIAGTNRSLGLIPVTGPKQFVSTPGQVGFTPAGGQVIVTTKANGSSIDVFGVRADGSLSSSFVANPSTAPVPFGFTFDRDGRLVVTEAGGSHLSTYTVNADGSVARVGTVADGQAALCWVAAVHGRFYGANAGSATISGFRVDEAGQPSLIGSTGVVAVTGAGAIDLAATRDGRFLYAQAGVGNEIDVYRVNRDGTLASIGSVAGGGPNQEGIAAD